MKIMELGSEELVSRLMLTVINYKENEDKIQNFPYIHKGNFALLAQLCVGEKNDAGQYTACLTVTQSMLEKWGLPKEQLFEIAADNSKKLFPTIYLPMTSYYKMQGENEQLQLNDDLDISEITVLTNKQHFNGAATLFYDSDVLAQIASQSAVDKLILMPSGVNQVYCVPYKNDDVLMDCQEIYKGLIEMINKENRLTDNILSYDVKSNSITEANGESYELSVNENLVKKQEHRR